MAARDGLRRNHGELQHSDFDKVDEVVCDFKSCEATRCAAAPHAARAAPTPPQTTYRCCHDLPKP